MQWLINLIKDTILPPGTIVLWHGSWASIPDGWGACDGLDGKPDLRTKFVRGAGSGLTPGQTGGSDTHLLPSGTGVGSGKSWGRTQDNVPAFTAYWYIIKL